MEFNLKDYVFYKKLVGPEDAFVSHALEIWKHKKTGRKVVVKKVLPEHEHSLVADIIGQRFFLLAGLPVPRTDLVFFKGKACLVEEFLTGFSSPANPTSLPSNHKNNSTIKKGILLDIWLGHYDRQPYNFMFKGKEAVFIDFGGCLLSSPSGKIKGFLPKITDQEIRKNITAFQNGDPVNEAYGSVLQVEKKTKKIIIKNRALLKRLVVQLKGITDEQIESIVNEHTLLFMNSNPARVSKIIKTMQVNLKIPVVQLHYRHYRDNYREAYKTYQLIKNKFHNNEKAYILWALKERKKSLIKRFSNI